MLYFDGTGLWVLTKRLEEGTFSWRKTAVAGAVKLKLTPEALAMPPGPELAERAHRWDRPARGQAAAVVRAGVGGVSWMGVDGCRWVASHPTGSGSLVRLSKIVVARG